MLDEVGEVAGRLWCLLGEKGEVSVSQIPMMLKLKGELAFQALGWLAREGKVGYRTDGGKTFVMLTESEREAFRSSFRS